MAQQDTGPRQTPEPEARGRAAERGTTEHGSPGRTTEHGSPGRTTEHGSPGRDTVPGAQERGRVRGRAGLSEEALDREAEEVTVAVMAASRLIVALSARALASVDVALTLPQLRSLVALHTCGPIKLAAMAATLGVTPSTALRMAERLEGLGLTDRRVNPDNRREVVLRLTGAGEDLVERVLGHRRAEIRALVERLPAPQRAGLVPALTALATAAGGLDPGLAPTDEAGRLAGVLDDPLNPAP
ncbi:MarR family winged helix-turn-helix transcriptional regulator [Streptomyces sp. MUSC 14]|uniref:MarR family winged helix-turn-helix transcriptional regulator n=1 Tax=Streptomyces sp. MUSC 14 TaxID=1354889 RepID=UPI000A3F7FF7